MSRRILFAIRSKLGDTLISFACVRAYADAHPQDDITLLTRNAYATLLRAEHGMRVIGFDSRLEMFFRLMWLRIREPAFDILAVLWGSGAPIKRIGQWVKAKRKIAWSGRFAPDIFEEGVVPRDPLLVEPAASVIRAFDASFALPQQLHIPSLAQRYRAGTPRAIGVVPIADERRRNFDAPTLLNLLTEVRRRHPHEAIRVFINPGNDGAESLVHQRFPDGVELHSFTKLDDLLRAYLDLQAWYGTDTGLYHLAASIGIPATVFFGPTQPHKIVMPAQPEARWVRLNVLGDSHCDEKSCGQPVCLHQAVATFCATVPALTLNSTPAACPLRASASVQWTAIRTRQTGPANIPVASQTSQVPQTPAQATTPTTAGGPISP